MGLNLMIKHFIMQWFNKLYTTINVRINVLYKRDELQYHFAHCIVKVFIQTHNAILQAYV